MVDINERTKQFAAYLADAQIKITNKRHKIITGTEMAIEAGVAQASLSRWMSGAQLPDSSNGIRICTYLWQQLGETTAFELLNMPAPRKNDYGLLSILLMLKNESDATISRVLDYVKLQAHQN